MTVLCSASLIVPSARDWRGAQLYSRLRCALRQL